MELFDVFLIVIVFVFAIGNHIIKKKNDDLIIKNDSLLDRCRDAELDLEEARQIIKNYHEIINGNDPF